jgi:hypothetical protein
MFKTQILVMPLDKSLFLKEFRNGYYPVSAFFFATIICNMLLQCFYSILLSGITYFIIGLWPTGEAFGTFFAVFLIIGLIGNCMGFALGVSDFLFQWMYLSVFSRF